MRKCNNDKAIVKVVREVIHYGKDLTLQQSADMLGIAMPHLSRIVCDASPLTPEMCIRLEKVFGVNARELAIIQLDFDLQKARKKIDPLNLQPYQPK